MKAFVCTYTCTDGHVQTVTYDASLGLSKASVENFAALMTGGVANGLEVVVARYGACRAVVTCEKAVSYAVTET